MRSRTERTLVLALWAALCVPAAAERGAPGPAVEEVLTSTAELTAPDAEALLDVASHRSPGLRQQAVERLVANPAVAAAPVVARFASSGLATRLSCLELLERWGAPVAGIDPWAPDTVRAAQPRLEAWLAQPRTGAAPRAALDPEALERALDDLLGTDEPRASGALERLTAVGGSLAPRLRELATRVTDDRVARRIAVLRYRLAMTRVLAAKRPTLPFELATTSGPSRAQLIERELVTTGAEGRSLLLELVQDAHPLVRETAVKLLRKQGGASDRLGALLADPDPNVRAAVLKELTSSPEEALAAELAKYVAREHDEDLLVHAARALAGLHGKVAVQATLSLLSNASWRVRAEAVESLKKRLDDRGPARNASMVTEIVSRVRGLLLDPDRFVRAKSIAVMQATDDVESLDALLQIANTDVSLAPAALTAIAASPSMLKKATAALRKLCASPDPAVRAAAMRALGGSTQLSIAAEVTSLLDDKELEPRIAALDSLAKVLDDAKDQSGSKKPPGAELDPMRAKVLPRLTSVEARERAAALKAALFLGMHAEINPELIRAARKEPALLEPLASHLKLLDWRRRAFLLDIVIERPSFSERKELVEGLLEDAHDQALPLLWRLLDRGTKQFGVSQTDVQQVAAEKIHQLAGRTLPGGTEALRKQFDRHRTLRGTVALRALFSRDAQAASALAREVLADASANTELRANALRLLLARDGEPGRARLAMEQVKAGNQWALATALGFLAAGATAESVRELNIELVRLRTSLVFDADRPPPPLPADLKPDQLRWYLLSSGPEAAYAGNLLAMLKESGGVPALVAHYDVDADDREARTLLVDALVVLDRDEDVPILERVWKNVQERSQELKQFRDRLALMKCPAARELRRKIARARNGTGAESGAKAADPDDLLGPDLEE